jgi:hypothetical protein
MRTTTKNARRPAPPMPQAPQAQAAGSLEGHLGQALNAWSSGSRERALDLLRHAAVRDLGRPEPWYWIGRIQEEAGDPLGAAYSYFMARDRRYEPASVALRRMGRLER